MAKKKIETSSGAEFVKFLKKNPTLSRTGAYNKFREKGGKIRKQKALEIARAFLDVKRGENDFIGKSIRSIKTKTAKQIAKGERKEIDLIIPKTSKPRKGQSNIVGADGSFLSKKKATELRRLQRKLREDQGLRLSLKELAQTNTEKFKETEVEYMMAHSTRNTLSEISAFGVNTVTIIDRNGKKTTFTGTLEELESNPQFMRKLEDEQQRLFQGADDALRKRGLEKDYKDKNSDGYKIFQMQLKKTIYNDNFVIFDYRDINEELSGIGPDAIIEERKKIRKQK